MGTLARVILFSLLFILGIGLAHAEDEKSETTYTVKKGDWLAKIAPKFGSTWNAIAKANNIAKPYIIYPGQKLSIPQTKTVTEKSVAPNASKVFLWKKPGNAKCQKCTLDRSVQGLGYPDVVARALIAKVNNRDFTMIEIGNGMHFDAMYFGKFIRKENVIASWNKGHTEPAREYSVTHDGTRYALVYPLICSNWSKTTRTVVPPHDVGPPLPPKKSLKPDHVMGILPERSPESFPEKIVDISAEAACTTCPDLIVLATFEPVVRNEAPSSWNANE